jgi:hypothetical protein
MSHKILNPETGRYVDRDGKIGKYVQESYNCKDLYLQYKKNCNKLSGVYCDSKNISKMSFNELVTYLDYLGQLRDASYECTAGREYYRDTCVPPNKRDYNHDKTIRIFRNYYIACEDEIKQVHKRLDYFKSKINTMKRDLRRLEIK